MWKKKSHSFLKSQVQQDHGFPKDLTTALALGGILVSQSYFIINFSFKYYYIIQSDIFPPYQIYTGSFSLGMGAIPWVIMSEVIYLNKRNWKLRVIFKMPSHR